MKAVFRYGFLTIIWALFIMVLTFTPGPSLPPLPHWDFISFDTFVHSTIFAVLVFLMSNSFKRQKKSNIFSKYPLISSICISILYGCFIEVVQPYIPGRNFDYYDILSNTIGCMVGMIAAIIQSALGFSPDNTR